MGSPHDDDPSTALQRRLERLEARVAEGVFWRRAALATVALAVSLPFAVQALDPVPNAFTNGAVISASQMNANFTYLQDAITALEARVPAGTVAFFDSTTCPAGWSELLQARGRTIVGLVGSAGSLKYQGGGTALVNQGTRTITQVPLHQHDVGTIDATISGGSHNHTITNLGNGGGMSWRPHWSGTIEPTAGDYTVPSTNSSHSHTVTMSGATASTGVASVDVTMPYVQLLVCRRD